MAKTHRSGVKPRDQWRCMVEGCPLYGVWRDMVEGEEYIADTADKRSHYWREHYEKTEAEFNKRLADFRVRRREHYRLTGTMMQPDWL